jgi:hypothetical protein
MFHTCSLDFGVPAPEIHATVIGRRTSVLDRNDTRRSATRGNSKQPDTGIGIDDYVGIAELRRYTSDRLDQHLSRRGATLKEGFGGNAESVPGNRFGDCGCSTNGDVVR